MDNKTLEQTVYERIKLCDNTRCRKALPNDPEEYFVSPYSGHYCNEACYKEADRYEFD